MNDYDYIDNPASLEALIQKIHQEPWLAIDTEFLRTSHYFSKLCLIQIGTEQWRACVDPLACPNLADLFEALNHGPTLVFHSGHQDLEIFLQYSGELPQNIFDTQLAAILLKQGMNIGYARMVHLMLGLELDKSQVRTDWSRRPLTDAQIHYAVDDVRYLAQVYVMMMAQLSAHDLELLAQDFAVLQQTDTYQTDYPQLWQKIPRSNQLQGHQRCALQQLAIWREMHAMNANTQRRRWLNDEALFDLAVEQPRTFAQLYEVSTLPGKIAREHGDEILDTLKQAQQIDKADWPYFDIQPPMPAKDQSIADRLVPFIKQQATEYNIPYQQLTSKRDIARLVHAPDACKLLTGWRHKVIGQPLCEALKQLG